MITSGLVSITFRKLAPFEIVKLVLKASLKAIEWGGDVHVPHGNLEKARDVRKLTADADLSVAAYGSYYRVGASEAEGLSFEKVLETAAILEAPTIRVWAGNRGSQDTRPEQRQTIIEESRRIAEIAAGEGISVSFEYHKNTLTDTNASAQQLLGEIRHRNVRAYWQPPIGASTEYCLEGLRGVLPYLTNIHVFHWLDKNGELEQRPLAEAAQPWKLYLDVIDRSGREHYSMIEFVRGESPKQLLMDATALKSWLSERASSKKTNL